MFAICRGVKHIIEAHKTKYVGGSHGVSFKVAKNVRYRVGAYRGHRVTTYYEKEADTGNLYITSKRVLFAGSKEITSVTAGKIADIRMEGDHLWILVENRKTPVILQLTVPMVEVMGYAIRMLAESTQRR
jgi:hypothetical protein